MTGKSISGADLDGLLAYGCLVSVGRLGKDVAILADTRDKAAVARSCSRAQKGFEEIASELAKWGGDVHVAMAPYVGGLDDLDARLRPGDSWERIVKTYISVGTLTDMASLVHNLVRSDNVEYEEALSGFGYTHWAQSRILAAVEYDTALVDRLSLWGRRVFGEVLGPVRRILFDELDQLGGTDADPAELLRELLEDHKERMSRAGLRA